MGAAKEGDLLLYTFLHFSIFELSKLSRHVVIFCLFPHLKIGTMEDLIIAVIQYETTKGRTRVKISPTQVILKIIYI